MGDNYLADFIGAQSFGFHALYLEDSEYSINLIKKKINEANRKL